MKRISALIFVVLCVFLPQAYAEIVELNVGTIDVPHGYTNKRTGTKDSERGELSNPIRNLIIYYDIGAMAGTHMNSQRTPECLWYQEYSINNRKIFSGIRNREGKRQLIITITQEPINGAFWFPANFWADINKDEDIAEVLLTALSYLPHPGK